MSRSASPDPQASAGPGDDQGRVAALLERYEAARARLSSKQSIEAVQACLELLDELLAELSLSADQRRWVTAERACVLLDRHKLLGDPADVDRAEGQAGQAFPASGMPAQLELELGDGYRRRFRTARQVIDAQRAIEHLTRAVAGFTGPPTARTQAILALLEVHRGLWEATRAAPDLNRAIAVHEWVLGMKELGAQERAWYLNGYAARLHDRFVLARDCTDLDAAIEAQRETLAVPGMEFSARVAFTERLAGYLTDHVWCSGAVADLEQARAILSAELDGRALDPLLARLLSQRGTVNRALHDRTGDLAWLDAAVDDQEAALAVPGLPNDSQVSCRARAANARRQRYRDAGDTVDLDIAITHADAAVSALPAEDRRRCWILNASALCYGLRYERTGEAADLERALALWDQAVAAGRRHADSENLPVALSNLGDYLTRHGYVASGDAGLLKVAIALLREASTTMDPDELPRILNTWGVALQYRFEAIGDVSDLREAIALHERALTLTPPRALSLPMRLDNHARALMSAGSSWGEPRAIERAIQLRRRASELIAPGTHDRDSMMANLALTHLYAYHADGVASHLTEAEEIISRLRGQERTWAAATTLNTSALVLVELHDLRQDPALLDEAVHLYTAALEKSAAQGAIRPYVLINLAQALHRYALRRHASEQVEAAIRLMESTIAELPTGHRGRAVAEQALAKGYWVRGVITGNRDDIEAAVALNERAMSAATEGTLDHIRAGFNLALIIRSRFEVTGAAEDLSRARDLLGLAARPSTSPVLAIAAASSWGQWAEERGNRLEATEAYRLGLQAMYRLFDTQLLRPDRELALRQAAGLVNRLAVVLSVTDKADEAFAVLEAGRTMLASASLDLAPGRLKALAGFGREDLLDRYIAASSMLEALASERARGAAPRQVQIRELEEAHQRLDLVIEEIRAISDFGDFPRPQPPSREQIDGLSAPCLYLVPGLRGGTAIRVGAGLALVSEPLPGATQAAVEERTEAWQRGAAAATELLPLTGWLWDVAMCGALALLEPDSEAILIPCGGFVDLPLHAAWKPSAAAPDGRRYVLEDYAIRYAPSLRAAVAAQSRGQTALADSDTAARPSLLAVADRSLDNAGPEIERLSSYFPHGAVRVRARAETRHAELLAEVADFDVLHFACHGLADPDDALNSAIYACADAPLRLGEIVDRRLPNARLVVLSACESAVSDQRLHDEVLNLPSAVLQAGAAGALGSLWRVNDAATAALMQRFYWLWRVGKLSPARALQTAQAWLRDPNRSADRGPELPVLASKVDPSQPLYWAAFIFVGA